LFPGYKRKKSSSDIFVAQALFKGKPIPPFCKKQQLYKKMIQMIKKIPHIVVLVF